MMWHFAMTPVASPLRPAYHFWAQDWIEGYKNAVPSPAGMLKARKNPHPAQPGRKAAAKKPPQSRAVPHNAAQRGPFLSCKKPPSTEKAAAKRQKHPRPFPGADAAHKAVLAVCGRGVLFHPGGAVVQPHHLKAPLGWGVCWAQPEWSTGVLLQTAASYFHLKDLCNLR